jgi:prepilin-type N-terminal cleavage/methylation domain-containing protein
MRPSPTRRQQGFTLIEMTIAMVLLLVGLLIAADLLMESSRLFVESAGESLDTPVPQVTARIRADVQGATQVVPELVDGKLDKVHIQGGGSGEIVYQKLGNSIYRVAYSAGGLGGDPQILWRGVTRWSCDEGSKGAPALISVTYMRRTTPHTPLPVLPSDRGALTEERRETMYLLPRGDGW